MLGWTNRTPRILQELLSSEEQVRRFLRRFGTRRLAIVALADDVSAQLVQSLKEGLGAIWDPRAVILRSGSALHVEHLQRVSFSEAAAVIVPGADFAYGNARDSDAHIIKTILTVSRFGRDENDKLPLLVAELFDDRKLHVARQAYDGPIEILTTQRLVSRLLTQMVRHEHVWRVFAELLNGGDGNEVYVRPCGELSGLTFAEASSAFPHAILLGFVRPSGDSYTPVLAPEPDERVNESTRAVLISRSLAQTEIVYESRAALSPTANAAVVSQPRGQRRVLLLGWNAKAPALLREFADYDHERFEVHILVEDPVQERERQLADHIVSVDRLQIHHHVGDFTLEHTLKSVQPETFDAILLLASDTLHSGEETDAHTVTGHLVLQALLASAERHPRVLVEVLEDDSSKLLAEAEHLVSPVVASHMLAQVALRRELRAVFDVLFGPGGAEIAVEPIGQYAGDGEAITFEDLRSRAHAQGRVGLGVIHASGVSSLNPEPSERWMLSSLTHAVVLRPE